MGILERLLRVGEKKTLRRLHAIADQVNAIEDHYTDLTDAELQALYAHCRHTIYPSHYEGWGLPVVESLLHGNPV